VREFDEEVEAMSELEERELEERLRVELRRRDAPVGFAERVMQAVERPVVLPMAQRLRGRVWTYAVAAAVLLCVTTGERVREVRKRARADAEFEMAMQVTNRAMERAEQHAREQMQRAGLDMNDNGSTKEE